jgi:hypothetical protein
MKNIVFTTGDTEGAAKGEKERIWVRTLRMAGTERKDAAAE